MRYIYLELEFDKKSKMIIGSQWPLKEVKILYEIRIVFITKTIQLIIAEDAIINIAEQYISLFTQAIDKRLLLDEAYYNLGLLDNEYDSSIWIYHNEHKISIKKDKNNIWIGEQYRLCVYKERVSWLYNDQHGNIVLEVTPWFNVRKCKNKTIYEKWIKNYKPILKRTIAPEIAEKWVEQMQKLLHTVRKNSGLDPEYDFMANREKA